MASCCCYLQFVICYLLFVVVVAAAAPEQRMTLSVVGAGIGARKEEQTGRRLGCCTVADDESIHLDRVSQSPTAHRNTMDTGYK